MVWIQKISNIIILNYTSKEKSEKEACQAQKTIKSTLGRIIKITGTLNQINSQPPMNINLVLIHHKLQRWIIKIKMDYLVKWIILASNQIISQFLKLSKVTMAWLTATFLRQLQIMGCMNHCKFPNIHQIRYNNHKIPMRH